MFKGNRNVVVLVDEILQFLVWFEFGILALLQYFLRIINSDDPVRRVAQKVLPAPCKLDGFDGCRILGSGCDSERRDNLIVSQPDDHELSLRVSREHMISSTVECCDDVQVRIVVERHELVLSGGSVNDDGGVLDGAHEQQTVVTRVELDLKNTELSEGSNVDGTCIAAVRGRSTTWCGTAYLQNWRRERVFLETFPGHDLPNANGVVRGRRNQLAPISCKSAWKR